MCKARYGAAAALALTLAASAQTLFPAGTLRPDAVRQGALGSCYFHASIAGLVAANPGQVSHWLSAPAADGSVVVTFADGSREHVIPGDVTYARSNGYDRSDGLWVAFLLRGFAQHVLRASLLQAVAASPAPAPLRAFLEDQIRGSDLLLDYYDRAARNLVSQTGTFTGPGLKGQLDAELGQLPLPLGMGAAVESWLLSPESLDRIAATLNDNGEVFGAYRAVGNGGLPLQVMRAFAGAGHIERSPGDLLLATQLAEAELRHRAVVADTQTETVDGLQAAGVPLPANFNTWFVSRHAYTVLGYNGATVTLRNPWGQNPPPDGVFTLSLGDFARLFPVLTFQDAVTAQR